MLTIPPEELRARLLNKLANWKMLPEVAVRALAMARDPDCSIKEFSQVVERDSKLAFEILRIANSAAHATRIPIVVLRQAVTRLGLAHCRNVILSASLGSALQRLTLSEAWMQSALWRHSVLTGLIATEINQQFKLGFIGEEFTAGLIHDVGRSLLAVIAPNHFAEADSLDFVEEGDFLEHERAILRTDHCELAAWFLAHSNLPEVLVTVVGRHHTPELVDEHRSLVALTAVADHMANHVQRVGSADGYAPDDNAAMPVLFNESRRASFSRRVHDILCEAIKEANSPCWKLGRQ
ncbi:MAG: HDOD domain-containing protein [Planctomycetes bacterium]|nr:HDOD domain-containing protein [Planctomycetota bacterium]